MKLWIFNVLVAGALAYLFLGESEQTRVKSDLEWAKDKVETTIDKNRSGEAKQVDRADAIVEPNPVAPVGGNIAERLAPTPEPETKAVIEQRIETRDAAPARNAESKPPRTTQKPVSTVAVEPLEAPQAVMVAERSSGEAETARGETVPTDGALPREGIREGLPPLDDPEVARRRAIVLDVEQADTAADVDVHVATMAARERRDALNALAEDMELMFADRMSR